MLYGQRQLSRDHPAEAIDLGDALGDSPWMRARQMLAESLALPPVRMALGLFIASQAIRALLWLAPETPHAIPSLR